MKKDTSAENKNHRSGKKPAHEKSRQQLPDFKPEVAIAAWHRTDSTLLAQDQFESLLASVGGTLRARVAACRRAPPQDEP